MFIRLETYSFIFGGRLSLLSWQLRFGQGYIDHDFSSFIFIAIQSLDGSIGFIRIGHDHKAKAFILSSDLINDDFALAHFSIWCEKLKKMSFFPLKRNATYINIHQFKFLTKISISIFVCCLLIVFCTFILVLPITITI